MECKQLTRGACGGGVGVSEINGMHYSVIGASLIKSSFVPRTMSRFPFWTINRIEAAAPPPPPTPTTKQTNNSSLAEWQCFRRLILIFHFPRHIRHSSKWGMRNDRSLSVCVACANAVDYYFMQTEEKLSPHCRNLSTETYHREING